MAMSVSQNLDLGIDRATLQQVSQEILKRAAQKNSQYNNANSSVNFVQQRDLGVDLYKGNINSDAAKQIAMNNSGLQIQLSQNALAAINSLNNKAAQNVQKNVEGKVAFAVNELTANEQKTVVPKFNSIISLGTDKDKNGSNPFYHGELLMANLKKEEKTEEKSIFG